MRRLNWAKTGAGVVALSLAVTSCSAPNAEVERNAGAPRESGFQVTYTESSLPGTDILASVDWTTVLDVGKGAATAIGYMKRCYENLQLGRPASTCADSTERQAIRDLSDKVERMQESLDRQLDDLKATMSSSAYQDKLKNLTDATRWISKELNLTEAASMRYQELMKCMTVYVTDANRGTCQVTNAYLVDPEDKVVTTELMTDRVNAFIQAADNVNDPRGPLDTPTLTKLFYEIGGKQGDKRQTLMSAILDVNLQGLQNSIGANGQNLSVIPASTVKTTNEMLTVYANALAQFSEIQASAYDFRAWPLQQEQGNAKAEVMKLIEDGCNFVFRDRPEEAKKCIANDQAALEEYLQQLAENPDLIDNLSAELQSRNLQSQEVATDPGEAAMRRWAEAQKQIISANKKGAEVRSAFKQGVGAGKVTRGVPGMLEWYSLPTTAKRVDDRGQPLPATNKPFTLVMNRSALDGKITAEQLKPQWQRTSREELKTLPLSAWVNMGESKQGDQFGAYASDIQYLQARLEESNTSFSELRNKMPEGQANYPTNPLSARYQTSEKVLKQVAGGERKPSAFGTYHAIDHVQNTKSGNTNCVTGMTMYDSKPEFQWSSTLSVKENNWYAVTGGTTRFLPDAAIEGSDNIDFRYAYNHNVTNGAVPLFYGLNRISSARPDGLNMGLGYFIQCVGKNNNNTYGQGQGTWKASPAIGDANLVASHFYQTRVPGGLAEWSNNQK